MVSTPTPDPHVPLQSNIPHTKMRTTIQQALANFKEKQQAAQKVQVIVDTDKSGEFFLVKSSQGKEYLKSIKQFISDTESGRIEILTDETFIFKGISKEDLEW